MNEVVQTSGPADGPSRGPLTLTAFDVVGFGFVAFGLLGSMATVLKVQPTFAKMFADFRQPLPAFTLLCLQWWFPIALGLTPAAITGLGIFRRASRKVRILLMAATIFLTLALPAVFLIGMYLPVFSIAGPIK